jgi:hypothetical protein
MDFGTRVHDRKSERPPQGGLSVSATIFLFPQLEEARKPSHDGGKRGECCTCLPICAAERVGYPKSADSRRRDDDRALQSQ